MRTETPKGAWFMITAMSMAQRMKMIIGTGNPSKVPLPKNRIAGGKPPITPPLVAIDRDPFDCGHGAKRHQDGMNAQERHDHSRDQPDHQSSH